jgi:DNA helicase-2/ATP-dependent DNA helicase PcrA
MNEILEGLNSPQKSAVRQENGPLLVLAGAGSGKTKVLTHRIANLINNGAKPWEILSVTFTNKAAREMQHRLENLLGEQVAKHLWIGTFHSICGRILRQEIENYIVNGEVFRTSNFVIYDDSDSNTLIKQAVKAENLDEKLYAPKMVKATISMAKNKMIDADKFEALARDNRDKNIARLYHYYEDALRTNNAMDFDDLLFVAVRVLESSEEVLNKYKSRFSHILVDEFQDTNHPQYKLISLLYKGHDEYTPEVSQGRSLCVVGDIDQSIYSWRGADYKILLNFQKEFHDAELVKLEQNYRSTETILEAANSVIRNNRDRISKNLFSSKGKGELIICNETQDETEEAHFIADRIREHTNAGKYTLGECVVLYRTNAQSRAIEEAFMSRKIPYTMVGGQKFYERKEIKDIIAYLKLIYNPSDSQSLKRIINVPKRSIGATTVKKIEEIAQKEYTSLFSVLERVEEFAEFSGKVALKLKEFVKLINTSRSKVNETELSEFLSVLIEDIGYINELKEDMTLESESRIENIQEFISVARSQEDMGLDTELGEFLTRMSLVSDIDSLAENNDAVTLMTLHAAKGLEFPIVFMAGMEEGMFPHSRSLNNNVEMEEERRIMYVGVTRAKDQLYLSFAKRRLIYGDYRYFTPSRFLNEIPPQLLKTVGFKPAERRTSIYEKTDAQKTDSERRRDSFIQAKLDKPLSVSGGFGAGFKLPDSLKKSTSSTSNVVKQVVTKPITSTPTKIVLKPLGTEQKPAPKTASKTAQSTVQKPVDLFEIGSRVLHPKFGIGEIEQIVHVGNVPMYSVIFTSVGKRAIDAASGGLKKF